MRKRLSTFAIIVPLTFFTQSPVLKVYVNTKEVSQPEYTISAFARVSKDYVSILDTSGKKICIPEGIDITRIESFKFIVASDTLEFSIDKVLEDPKRAAGKSPMDDLREILSALKTWDLRINTFRYFNEDVYSGGKTNQNKVNGKNKIYKEYKIYALRTRYLRYYIVKN